MDTTNFKKLNFEKLMLPLLRFAENGKVCALKDAEKRLAKIYKLTNEQTRQKKPRGHGTTFLDRIFWARTYLERAGLISRPSKSHYQITDKGKKFLKKNYEELNTKILMQFSEFANWQNKSKINKKMKPKKYTKGFGVVVLCDALGTKGIANRHDYNQVIKEWKQFIQIIKQELTSIFGDIASLNTFSDTIVITVITKAEQVLYQISEILSRSIVESMLIDRPIRGCFSIGPIIKHNGLIIGDAIDEASEYYAIPNWIGISASHSAHFEIEKLNKKDSKKVNSYFQKLDIPLKESVELDAWAINWPDMSDEYIRKISGQRMTKYHTTQEIFDKNLKEPSNVEIGLKWRNTKIFFDSKTRDLMN